MEHTSSWKANNFVPGIKFSTIYETKVVLQLTQEAIFGPYFERYELHLPQICIVYVLFNSVLLSVNNKPLPHNNQEL